MDISAPRSCGRDDFLFRPTLERAIRKIGQEASAIVQCFRVCLGDQHISDHVIRLSGLRPNLKRFDDPSFANIRALDSKPLRQSKCRGGQSLCLRRSCPVGTVNHSDKNVPFIGTAVFGNTTGQMRKEELLDAAQRPCTNAALCSVKIVIGQRLDSEANTQPDPFQELTSMGGRFRITAGDRWNLFHQPLEHSFSPDDRMSCIKFL